MKKKTEKPDPLSFDDVPGLGEIGTKALHNEGFYTTLQVVCKTPTWLKDVTGMDKDKCGKAFAYMKNKLEDAGLLRIQEVSATDYLKERQKVVRVSTGCGVLDNLFNGGLECRAITEIYGEEGSGKTQTSHALALMAQEKIADGGLWEEGKPRPSVVYIDTENTCRPERLISILAGKGKITKIPEKIHKKIIDGKPFTPEEIKEVNEIKAKQIVESKPYLDSIHIFKATNAYQQFSIIQNMMRVINEINCKLLIVDSGTALFRSDYLGRGNTKAKFDLLNEMMHDLKMMAENYNIVVLFVNQIYEKPDISFGTDGIYAYGGHIVGHTNPYRIKFEHSGRKYRATIMKSPYQGRDEVKFDITEAGPVDPK